MTTQTMPHIIDFSFGSTSAKLIEQLRNQGVDVSYLYKGRLEHIQSDLDAIYRLHVRAYLTDRDLKRLQKKLLEAIGDLLDDMRSSKVPALEVRSK